MRIASKQAHKANIDKVIALYESRKIEKFRTAEKLILKLLSTRPDAAVKLMKKYEDKKEPWAEVKPPPVKLTRCSAFVILYVQKLPEDDNEKIYKRVRNFGGLRQLVAQNFALTLEPSKLSTLESLKFRLIINNAMGENTEFISSARILYTNADFKTIPAVTDGYLAALYVVRIDYPDEAEAEKYIPRENLSKDTTKSSCYYQYINTELDLTADTLHAALVNKAYTESECWINTLYDSYKDTLLYLKKRKVITRESILQILNRTEENIKDGLSINDVIPFSRSST